MRDASQENKPIAPETRVSLQQQLRASVHLLVGYCEGLLDDPCMPSEASLIAKLKDALHWSQQMRSLVTETLFGQDKQVDTNAVADLYETLSEMSGRIVEAMNTILKAHAGEPLEEYYVADVRAVRDVAMHLLDAETIVTSPSYSATLSAFRSASAKTTPANGVALQVEEKEPEVRTPRILVAEDTPDIRKILVTYLKRLGYDVEANENGKLALEQALENPTSFDMVLSDLEMPEMDGFELLERLKSEPSTRELPVIIISGLDDMPNVVKCIERGAVDHLPKPFEPVLLKARVEAALGQKRLRDKELDYLRKVEQMTDAACAVETGSYQTGSLAGIGRRADELGRLARMFDSMVTGVKAREDRLKSQVNHLRREVRATGEVRRSQVIDADVTILPTGELFAERYEVVEELGRGGMGMVYRALDRELQEEVAVKTLRATLLFIDTTMIERFKTELRLARSIAHRNVVRSYDFGEWEGTYYLTMEYVKGVTLHDLIAMHGMLSIPSTLAIGTQLADALAVAHETGVIHRDIKPRNLLLDKDGVLKILDFGIARPTDLAEGSTMAGTAVGTPTYMAPEQLFGQDVDTRADLYSVGVVLYECLTGVVPVDAATPFALAARMLDQDPIPPQVSNPDVSPALSTLVLRLLGKQAMDRPASAEELGSLLRQIQ